MVFYFGAIYEHLGNLGEALKMHKASLEHSLKGRSDAQAANAYGNLGNVYQQTGDHQRAIEAYEEKGLEIQVRIGDRRGVAHKYGNLANLKITLGQHAEAIKLLHASLELSKNLAMSQRCCRGL